MLITNHVLTGALIGLASPGPGTAFAAGVASHFVEDSLPHWGDVEYHDFLKVAVVDGLIGLATMTAIARLTPRAKRTRVVAGMLGASLPDADKPGVLFLGRSPFPQFVDDYHMGLQNESTRRMPQEIAMALVGGSVVRTVLRRG